MKILVTTMKNNDDKKIVSTQFLSQETDSVKHELIELEVLPNKEGYTQEIIYDKEKQQYKMQYKEIPKSEEEMTLNALKEQARKDIKVEELSKAEIQKNMYLFDKYVQNKAYKKDDIVQHLGKLYKCVKAHTSSYDLLPQMTPDYWKEITGKGKPSDPPTQPPFYSSDLTYNKGDRVTYYSKVYESLVRQSGQSPTESPKTWKLIDASKNRDEELAIP